MLSNLEIAKRIEWVAHQMRDSEEVMLPSRVANGTPENFNQAQLFALAAQCRQVYRHPILLQDVMRMMNLVWKQLQAQRAWAYMGHI